MAQMETAEIRVLIVAGYWITSHERNEDIREDMGITNINTIPVIKTIKRRD
jgi:hypothetical protein